MRPSGYKLPTPPISYSTMRPVAGIQRRTEWTVQLSISRWEDLRDLSRGLRARRQLVIRSRKRPNRGDRVQLEISFPNRNKCQLMGIVSDIPLQIAGFALELDPKHGSDMTLLESIASSNCKDPLFERPIDDLDIDAAITRVETSTDAASVRFQRRTVRESDLLPSLTPSPAKPQPPVEVSSEEVAISLDEDWEGDSIEPSSDTGNISREIVDPSYRKPAVTLPPNLTNPELRAPLFSTRSQPFANAFGIDFGTTYSSIGIVCGKEAIVIDDPLGRTMTPSVVSYADAITPLVGWRARERVVTHPITTVLSPKRLLGRKFDDPQITPYLDASPVPIARGRDGLPVICVHGEELSLTEICSRIMHKVATIAEARTGFQARQVVLAAPVSFEEQRAAIRQAAELAGLEVLAILDEPVAAAIDYGANRRGHEKVAVFDFGGGTFDFTMLETEDVKFRVLGEAGDPWLGGDDLDIAIAEAAADQFWRQHGIELRKRRVEWQQLLFIAEKAKRKLSVSHETVMRSQGLVTTSRGSLDLEFPITRDLLDSICAPLVDRAINTMETCFSVTGVDPAEINQVVLSGGLANMPIVQKRVESFFPQHTPVLMNPDQAIASGTAQLARQLAGTR